MWHVGVCQIFNGDISTAFTAGELRISGRSVPCADAPRYLRSGGRATGGSASCRLVWLTGRAVCDEPASCNKRVVPDQPRSLASAVV
jgi:hypothetical protein